MLSSQRHHLSLLLLTVLLLSGWTADGAQNGTETETMSSVRLASVPSSSNIVAKEGSSTLIECNVTGSHDDIKWYNSKGPLLGKETSWRREWGAERKFVNNFEFLLCYIVVVYLKK